MRYSLFVVCCLLTSFGFAQKIATIEVEITKEMADVDVPVSIDLDPVTFTADTSLAFFEIQGNKRTPIPFQVDKRHTRTLHWIIKSGTKKKRVYELTKAASGLTNHMKAVDRDGMVTLKAGDKNLLNYYYKTVYPPAGIDSAYKRSGFIHPLWSPKGQVLTRIQPPDHYHHYGVWNPWTHTLFEGDTVDFWNLKGRQGTVRFENFISQTNGDVFTDFQALQKHIVFKKDGSEKDALNEVQAWRVYRPDDNQDYYIADVTIQMSCASSSPLRILEYRYAGFGWRATEQWKKDNSEMLTSEGKTRKETDGTRARWCIVQGETDGSYAGAVLMSYPGNYNHPEPLRIWDENANGGRGDVFANFAPTKNMDWLLEPGNTYVQKYRLIVFTGRFSKEKAEAGWQYFAQSPVITVKKN